MKKVITDNLKEIIIKDYLSKPTKIQEIAEKYSLSSPTVIKILGKTKRWPKHILYNPDLDEDYFNNIDSDEKGYYLGLFISDGNIYDPIAHHKKQVQKFASITLKLDDEYMLKNFIKAVKSNINISHDGRGCGQACIRSTIFCDNLSKYGVIPNKTLLTYFPQNVNKKYWNSIVRGIFDGDGNIYLRKTNRRFNHSLNFCGTHKLMQDLVNIISEELNLNVIPKVYDYKDRNLSEIKFQNIHDIELICNWMYGDSDLYLTRKRDKYAEFMKHYNMTIPR